MRASFRKRYQIEQKISCLEFEKEKKSQKSNTRKMYNRNSKQDAGIIKRSRFSISYNFHIYS